MEKKLRLMLRIIKAVIEIFEMELDEKIERIKKNENKLEEPRNDFGGNYFDRFTTER